MRSETDFQKLERLLSEMESQLGLPSSRNFKKSLVGNCEIFQKSLKRRLAGENPDLSVDILPGPLLDLRKGKTFRENARKWLSIYLLLLDKRLEAHHVFAKAGSLGDTVKTPAKKRRKPIAWLSAVAVLGIGAGVWGAYYAVSNQVSKVLQRPVITELVTIEFEIDYDIPPIATKAPYLILTDNSDKKTEIKSGQKIHPGAYSLDIIQPGYIYRNPGKRLYISPGKSKFFIREKLYANTMRILEMLNAAGPICAPQVRKFSNEGD